MSLPRWQHYKTALQQWATAREAARRTASGARFYESDLVLVVKAIVLGLLTYYLFWSDLLGDRAPLWLEPEGRPPPPIHAAWQEALQTVRVLFVIYVAITVGTALLLLGAQHLKPPTLQALVFGVALLDAWFLAAIVALTGGMDSVLYWLYVVLVIRNCVSVPATAPQAALNLLTMLAYAAGAVADAMITQLDAVGPAANANALPDAFTLAAGLGRPFYLRIALLLAVALWSYGLQVLLERRRRTSEEQRELALRTEQLAAAGRLAAEIAHQLKNPLAIINTASYTLQKTVKEGKTITQQIQLIREEVERSDRLITELMGYAQLVEGRVEKLDLKEELERAIAHVFPPAVEYEVKIHRDYAAGLPDLLAQRNHLQDAFVNVLQNAREALQGRGNLWISTRQGENFSVLVIFEDDGPGVPPDLRERIFEPYFTTRDKGTGLGLAIVKHNLELYGGWAWVESELGQGARFLLQFPARTLMRLRK